MDLGIIGKFIQERRKAKKLTQVQLSEILEVSEKTISKWESGRGFPDTTLILPLCKVLDITANELLSGKLLPTDKNKALGAKLMSLAVPLSGPTISISFPFLLNTGVNRSTRLSSHSSFIKPQLRIKPYL